MATIAVSLRDDPKAFVESEAAAGGFATVSAYVESVLRAVWKERSLADLEAKIEEGINSGPAFAVTPELRARLLLDLKSRSRVRSAGVSSP